MYGKRNAMPSQAGGSRGIRTALSEACKYGIVHSQMHRFSRRLRRLPLFCTATGRLLAHMIIHGYDRRKLWLRVKRFWHAGYHGTQPDADGCSTGLGSAKRTPSHSTVTSRGNTQPIWQTRSDLTCFIAGWAAGYISCHHPTDRCIVPCSRTTAGQRRLCPLRVQQAT